MTIQSNMQPPKPLPITIQPGMTVVSLEGNSIGHIEGITQSHCIYTLGDRICVEPWSNIALTNVCPARPLLPRSVEENDRLNSSARVLGELSLLKSLTELSPTLTAAMDELLGLLCPARVNPKP